jgi:raffinose/stachyose/melibiose transport system permease protein
MITTETRAAATYAEQRRSAQLRRYTRYLLYWIAGGIVSAVILIPLFYSLFDGFKTNGDIAGNPGLLPSTWVFSNYSDLLVSGTFWRLVANSVLIAVIASGLAVGASALCAFVLARFEFRGREAVYTLFTIGLLFPAAVAVLPLFILIRTLGLIDNPLGVALPEAAFGLPITVIILRPFFKSIPKELEDAARIDGCGHFSFFWRILLPLSRPALATVAVLAIIGSWNAFFLPLLIFNSPDNYTLPLGTMNFSTEHTSDWARILAFTTLSMVPAIAFYMLAERQIVSGLTAGSVKG